MNDEDSGPPEFESPLDELFVEGARYREPSAEERARQAREFQRRGKEAARQNRRRRQQEVVRSGKKWLPWAGLAAVVLAIWGLMTLRSDGDDSEPEPTTSTTSTTTPETTTSTLAVTPSS